jgi:hypothetical protein
MRLVKDQKHSEIKQDCKSQKPRGISSLGSLVILGKDTFQSKRPFISPAATLGFEA